jgi:hypothetical protein
MTLASTASSGFAPVSHTARAEEAEPGLAFSSAWSTYDQNLVGSRSRSSSDTQAIACCPAPAPPRAATTAVSSVVLPKPAGAEMRVSEACEARWIKSIRRGRATSSRRGMGTSSFVSSSRSAIGAPSQPRPCNRSVRDSNQWSRGPWR